jgi:hypothetical protein
VGVSSGDNDFHDSSGDDTGFTGGGYNCSSDGTADDPTNIQTGAVVDKVFANNFESSSNLHLKSGADCIDNGTDLGTEANIDIDGRDRDSEGDTWDIGADEYVSVSTAIGQFIIINQT